MAEGWLEDAASFFTELEQHNERDWWQANRGRYDAVRAPFTAMIDDLDGWGAWRVYRPHNDTRFGNANPYKTFLGAVAERPDGVGAFVQVSARRLLVGTGLPMPARDQLDALRRAIADDEAGPALSAAIEATTATGATVHGGRYPPLTRVPRGFPADQPRGDLLRWKGIEVDVRPRRVAEVDEALARGAAVHRWLADHVGPSALTAEQRFAPRRRSG
jgi:uncharacterized protein (DUF2461 family)